MSATRSRAQKHQNRTAFKPDLYGCNKRISEAKTLAFGGVCTRCKDQIEWKKSFAKYKPLTAPRKWYVTSAQNLSYNFLQSREQWCYKKHICNSDFIRVNSVSILVT